MRSDAETTLLALVVRTAIDTGLTSLLPAAFYELQMWYPPGPNCAVDGTKAQPVLLQDELLLTAELKHFFLAMHLWSARFYSAVTSITVVAKNWDCIKAQQGNDHACRRFLVRDWVTQQLVGALNHFSRTPRNPIRFLRQMEEAVVLRRHPLSEGTSDPLSAHYRTPSNSSKVCHNCHAALQAHLIMKQKELWQTFASLFVPQTAAIAA